MKLAIIILSGDTPEVLLRCLAALRVSVKTEYKIYLAYNGCNQLIERKIRSYLAENFGSHQYKVVKYGYYNFASLNNDIIRNHLDPGCELVLFCNNDVLVQGDVVDQMVRLMQDNPQRFGTVGCRLLYGNGRIQHDGQFLCVWKNGQLRHVGHLNLFANPYEVQIPDSLVIGNTFALCLSSLEVFEKVGGLNELYRDCFEDVEYNLRCFMAGYVNVVLNSQHWAYHLESYTRKTAEEKDYVQLNDVNLLASLVKRFANSADHKGQSLILRGESDPPKAEGAPKLLGAAGVVEKACTGASPMGAALK
ncbi:MAG: hypothetical protein RLZZ399_1876 [Verrucomicrobiota bacterium]|jgi:GT2 family glycosyltransferase